MQLGPEPFQFPIIGSEQPYGHRERVLIGPTVEALDTMQSEYFQLWVGTWPSAIDWTAAVLGTLLSGGLLSLSSQLPQDLVVVENKLDEYFSQLVTFYFGQDAFSLRTQANDDMLWVVLGWLDSIRFMDTHAHGYHHLVKSSPEWHGMQFQPPFAHRARIFYDIASKGWDTTLCGGGMNWSPYLRPYKNAITNELFIAASVNMYLYFPGDNNSSPFLVRDEEANPRDKTYLEAAVKAYDWLASSNMTNSKGLYVDGYHISESGGVNNTKCDERDEMVYTYNQGVLLSGLRGLWESTEKQRYLRDGHALVQSVINATGWSLEQNQHDHSGRWKGIGRSGVLEEVCDAGGYCSQNGQIFKGIFFHHLTAFCAPLDQESCGADQSQLLEHRRLCKSYRPWVFHNARAAFATRDEQGRFGMWWGEHPEGQIADVIYDGLDRLNPTIEPLVANEDDDVDNDVNDRGRGRTVETQGGGVAVLRAAWEFQGL
ncbi:MAG: hypothetical protein M1814_002708 [Vezdaea aestivalis]|nr:MAG: hypothetical protein M1814_002708 [Vezdaea aestivalis]